MKGTRFTEHQIVKILKEFDNGVSAEDLSRQYRVGKSTLYTWKSKYGGLETSELKRLKQLEEENRKLKQMYANLSLDYHALKDVLSKKG